MTTLHPLRLMLNFYLSSHLQSPSHSRYHEHLVLLLTFFYQVNIELWNLNPQWSWSPSRKMSIIQNFKERGFMTICVDPPCVSGVWRPPHVEGCVLCWLGPWDLSISSPSASHWRQFKSQSRVPTSRVTGARDRGPGAHRLGSRGAATNIRMSLQPMFPVSPARYNHSTMEI